MKKLSAEERAYQLMRTPINQLPTLANKYMRYVGKEYGGCMDVFFCAFAEYAQAIEKLKVKDKTYKITKDSVKWFKENKNEN